MTDGDQGSGEDRLIARYFKPLATHPGALGLTDDTAFFTPEPGQDLVLTTDSIAAGVHFMPDDPAGQLARKALRVNLSDVAAKGAKPLGFLLSIALGKDVPESWLSSFATGLKDDCEIYGCALLGGDTDRTAGPLTITIAMIGSLPSGTMVKRAGARPGDAIMVSGTIGDAALGVYLRRGAAWKVALEDREYLLSRYLLPQPRTALAEAVRTHASAAMDVSDGLAGDLSKLCRVSGVAATVEVQDVPLSVAARNVIASDPAVLETAVTGGDDYEILCTVPPDKVAGFKRAAVSANVPVTQIGVVAQGEGVTFLDAESKSMQFARPSYSHF